MLNFHFFTDLFKVWFMIYQLLTRFQLYDMYLYFDIKLKKFGFKYDFTCIFVLHI